MNALKRGLLPALPAVALWLACVADVGTPPAFLQQVILAPAAATVPAGTTQQFTAVGQLSDGGTVTPQVTWTATGGTISAAGQYTAGSTAGSFQVIASWAGLADTSPITIAVTIPTVTAIVVTPASASLPTGGTQQFAAVATLSDGSTQTNPSVTWTATGGAITTNGMYTAGVVPGSFRVIATQSGGTRADTASVTLTLTGAGTYTTNFPTNENPISEGGRWINGGVVGMDWTNVSTTGGLAIGHQVGPSYTDGTALLTGVWGPDQFASATVYSVNQNESCYQEVELRLRSAMAAHVNTGYEVGFKASQSSEAYLIIVRWNGALGNFTYLFDQYGAQYGVRTGDVVSASIVGNVITAYKNGVEMARVTDNTYRTGSPGMGFNLGSQSGSCRGSNGNYGFTSYTATDEVPAALRAGP